jgi:hypothetical protein
MLRTLAAPALVILAALTTGFASVEPQGTPRPAPSAHSDPRAALAALKSRGYGGLAQDLYTIAKDDLPGFAGFYLERDAAEPTLLFTNTPDAPSGVRPQATPPEFSPLSVSTASRERVLALLEQKLGAGTLYGASHTADPQRLATLRARVGFRAARFDFVQLYEAKERLAAYFPSGVVGLGLAVQDNRVVYSLVKADPDLERQIRAHAASVGLDPEILRFTVTGEFKLRKTPAPQEFPISTNGTPRTFRPLRAGLGITNAASPNTACTFGFFAEFAGQEGMVTNLHCVPYARVNTTNAFDSIAAFQSLTTTPSNQYGVYEGKRGEVINTFNFGEFSNPYYNVPRYANCRKDVFGTTFDDALCFFADAVFIPFKGPYFANYVIGSLARTTFDSNLTGENTYDRYVFDFDNAEAAPGSTVYFQGMISGRKTGTTAEIDKIVSVGTGNGYPRQRVLGATCGLLPLASGDSGAVILDQGYYLKGLGFASSDAGVGCWLPVLQAAVELDVLPLGFGQ